jgi:hypothetical protein
MTNDVYINTQTCEKHSTLDVFLFCFDENTGDVCFIP